MDTLGGLQGGGHLASAYSGRRKCLRSSTAKLKAIIYHCKRAERVNSRPARRLEIEITETAVIENSDEVRSNLRALRELGIRISPDDFGTGYSSLTCVRKLSPDSIKIDGSFVRELTTNSGSRSIVKSLIDFLGSLPINIVAEGIETSEQLNFLRRNDCHEGQGYLLSVPKSANEIGPYLLTPNAVENSAA